MRLVLSAALSACLLLLAGATVSAQSTGQPTPPVGFEYGECPFDASSVAVPGLRCGYLTVPESRGAANGRAVRIAVAVSEPAEATADPVVLLPGGPGPGALPGWIARVRRWIPPDRTLIVFDPRGTGFSGPVMCPELNETGDAIAALDLSTEEAELVERGAYLACRDRLLRQGIDLGAYNSTTVALDLRDLRHALGHEQWNIMSGSYGVPFARAAMQVDPEGIRSAVLAIGPGPVITDLLRRDVPFFARALERVYRGCAADAACTAAFPDVEADFQAAYASLLEEPLTVQVARDRFNAATFTVNAQDFVRMVYWELTSETAVAHLPSLIGAFRNRDAHVVRQWVEREYGGLTSTSSRMGTSVLCYDAHTPESRQQWEEAAAPFPRALAQIQYFLLPCGDWHEARASAEERGPHESGVPALVITGEYDPMNPPVTGAEQLASLPNGYHVAIPGMGHGPRARSEPCWTSLITQFMVDPTKRPADSCTGTMPAVRILPELPDWVEQPVRRKEDTGAERGFTVNHAEVGAFRPDDRLPGSLHRGT